MAGLRALRADDPRQVGAYRLVGLLGEGGQGTVYQGLAPGGEPVAVKLLHARFAGDDRARARFAAELDHARRVAAFCTARVLDADVTGDRPHIVSEFVEGPSLAQVIASHGPVRGSGLERLAIATVTALAAIHEAGVVHRDFKPGNVIMGPDGPRVIDFGIARALDATGTMSSAVVGTPAYMAPEQIAGRVAGPAADVFAWACTIAYAATGVTPFGQDSIPAVMNRILHADPDLGPPTGALTGPLREILTGCLAKDPVRRPTARQILLRLLGGDHPADTLLVEGARASTSHPDAATPSPTGPPAVARAPLSAGHRAVAWAGAAGALLLGATAFLPWAEAEVSQRDHAVAVVDLTGRTGIWGVLTIVAAALALAISLTSAFTRAVSAGWAAVPCGFVVLSLAGSAMNLHDELWDMSLDALLRLDGQGKLAATLPSALRNTRLDGLRGTFGMSADVSLAYGWYLAVMICLVLMALAVVSIVLRRSR
ncbi:serine/threonine-protein kinase [Microbispora sitophila]|uniref:serine/threonine-protein kinase n=1 Tax=Microbispora sitophila TaxID=2771537 RepID=UPI001D007792|nr:serine/threonine-protein kinase [Microbispora sitophila]